MESTKLKIRFVTSLFLMLAGLLMKPTLGDNHREVSVDGRFKLTCPVKPVSSMIPRWLKENQSLDLEAQTHIEMKGLKLKFNGVKLHDSGRYSCDKKVNGTWIRVKTWRITVLRGPTPATEPPCGKPSDNWPITYCDFQKHFPNCKSFPDKPREPKVKMYLKKGLPAINVQWKPPIKGFGDLWGYAVSLLGYGNHANHQECFQFNSKQTNLTNFTFHTFDTDYISVLFGATYHVSLTSLPPLKNENSFEKFVTIPEKCDFKEFKVLAECYKVSNLTASGNQKSKEDSWVINVTWNQHQRHLNSLSEYYIYWISDTMPQLDNDTTVKANQTQISFELSPTTRCLNLTIIVFGLTTSGEKTKKAKTELPFIGACPTPPPPVTFFVTGPANEKSMTIAVIVGSIAFSIMLVILFVVYRVHYKRVILRLPPAFPSNGDVSDPMLECQHKKRQVYIVHTSCCEKCKWAVTQLGDLLCKTGLIDVGLDLWDTLEMLPNKPLYYEKKIRESDCVVVVADGDMKQCALSSKDGKPTDDKYVRFQLDLIRGELTSNPDTRKYIPVYMSFNSTKKDIPDFLSSRISHALPEEIDRVVFHLLNIERIQPGRRRMVAIIGGNDHPYDEAKRCFEAAVDDAERYHLKSRTTSNKVSDKRIELDVYT